jgi:hypothetical protein
VAKLQPLLDSKTLISKVFVNFKLPKVKCDQVDSVRHSPIVEVKVSPSSSVLE